jgi:hypothetical protein
VCTVSGSRSFNGDRHSNQPACLDEGADIVLPSRAIEIGGKEEAGFVCEQRIDAHHVAPLQVIQHSVLVT